MHLKLNAADRARIEMLVRAFYSFDSHDRSSVAIYLRLLQITQ